MRRIPPILIDFSVPLSINLFTVDRLHDSACITSDTDRSRGTCGTLSVFIAVILLLCFVGVPGGVPTPPG